MLKKQSKRTAVSLQSRAAWLKAVLGVLVVLLPASMLSGTAFASGDAGFTFSSGGGTTVGNTFTVVVSETSSAGDNTNTVEANVGFPSAQLQYQSMSLGAFSTCLQQSASASGAQLACAYLSNGSQTSLSGTQTVATFTFKVVGTGSGQLSMLSGSNIDSTSGSSVWNGSLTSATYSFSAAQQQTSGGGTTTSGSSSSGSGSHTSGSTSTPSSTPSSASTPTPASSTPSTTATTTPKTTTNTKTSSGGSSSATNPVVTVSVVDTNGKPIQGAKVVVDGVYTVYTNAIGVATVNGVTSGNHKVTITASGKTTTETSLSLTPNEVKAVSFKMANAGSPALAIIYVFVGLVVLGGAGFGLKKLSAGRKITLHSPIEVTNSTPTPAAPTTPITTAVPVTPQVVQPVQAGPIVSDQNVQPAAQTTDNIVPPA